MNEFSKSYIFLLKKQVDEEIKFLINNGHDNKKIYVPCIFCHKNTKGYYVCYRLNELRLFQSRIVEHEFSPNALQERNIPKARREIGFEGKKATYEDTQIINLNTALDISTMPLLNEQI